MLPLLFTSLHLVSSSVPRCERPLWEGVNGHMNKKSWAFYSYLFSKVMMMNDSWNRNSPILARCVVFFPRTYTCRHTHSQGRDGILQRKTTELHRWIEFPPPVSDEFSAIVKKYKVQSQSAAAVCTRLIKSFQLLLIDSSIEFCTIAAVRGHPGRTVAWTSLL